MKLPSWLATKPRAQLTLRDMALGGLLAALMYASQIVMAGLPNIEAVSFLVILYTLFFPILMPYILAVFILLEGLTFGFGIWWVCYLYLWPLLAVISHLLRRQNYALFWAIISGVYGLLFGALCAIPWFFAGGLQMGVAYWLSGIPYDIAHCLGNFTLMLLLYRPVAHCFSHFAKRNIT